MGHPPPASPEYSSQQRWQLRDEDTSCGALELFALDVPAAELARLAGLLSDGERARAARFLDAAHGRRFTVAHGRLRQLLAAPLGLSPQDIEFSVGAHGKPQLAGAAMHGGMHFNLSHSGGLGLVGWSRHMQIGVDVEVWRPMRDMAGLVQRYFSPAEIAAWESLAAARREEAFFNLWTRKEAYVKALGRGLSLALASFEVSHERGAGARLLRQAPATEGRQWSLVAPEAGSGVSLAAVLEAGLCHIQREP